MSVCVSPLETLLAPLAGTDILSLFTNGGVTLIRGTDAERRGASGVLGWEALREMIARGEYPRGRDHIRVAKESVPVPPTAWTVDGKVDPDKLEEYLAQDYSIIITHLESQVPLLAEICEEIKSRYREASYAGVIVTAGTAGAIKLHFDFEDLIIFQIEGTKRWQIFGPAASNPLRKMPPPPEPDTTPVFEETLEPGDVLCVPAGNWHHCECGPGRSVHLGLFFIPATPWHAVRELSYSSLADELFRVRLNRIEDPAEFAALEAEFKARLIERINALDLRRFADRWPKMAYSS
jgi:hypothetical protein